MSDFGTNDEHRAPRKRSTKREMTLRDSRLIRALAAGQPIEELAAREGITLRRARERVSAVLSRRPDPPAEFANLQIRRLNEALVVATAMMSAGNLQAIDRVMKLTRELDRYAGFSDALAAAAAFVPAPEPAAPLASGAPLALAPPCAAAPPPIETSADVLGEII